MFSATKIPTMTSAAKMKFEIDTFLGADLTNSPENVEQTRSPYCPNMIRAVPGKVRKRMGYKKAFGVNGRINGHFVLNGDKELIHAGTSLYEIKENDGAFTASEIYSGLADDKSRAWEFDKRLFIADGKQYLVFDGETACAVSEYEKTHIPIFKIACDAKGIGTEYESINLLTPKYEQHYAGIANQKTYQLSLVPLNPSFNVNAKVLKADGTWQEILQGEGLSVNHETGLVTFVTAPGASVITGEDNIKITAARDTEKAAEGLAKINSCKFGIQFGVNGANDRLFLSGNAKYKNYDWFSQFNDATYFADLSYCILGQNDSAIVGYSIINARLAAHKDGQDAQRNVMVREGNLSDGKPTFPIINIIQGEGAAAPHSFAYIANEPVFLTRLGVYAITAQDMTGEKYSQCRSFFLNGQLLKEDLSDAYACIYRDMYFLCFAKTKRVYVLDGLQAVQTDRSAPYSTRQYAGFYLTDINARCMWEKGGVLWFGNDSGEVFSFYENEENIKSYSDDGRAIYAAWQTPELSGKTSYRNKSYSRIYCSLGSAAATGVRVLTREGGIWEEIFSDYSSARFFSFAQLCFSKLSFSSDATPRTLGGKIRIKKVDKAGFRLENNELNEPFSLNSISLEFKENGYYKGR